MLMDRLNEAVKQKGPVCVGLDTRYDFLPGYLKQKNWAACEKIFEFNRRIVEATLPYAACYKVQIACYEALGMQGMACFQKTLAYLRNRGAIAISDVKRGDISSTAADYARGHFTGDFETDCITVNAYMGEDAVSPYYDYLKAAKGIFVLIKTSNPSSVEIQDLPAGDAPVYLHMAELVSRWGAAFIGTSGYSAMGAVVGLTYPEEFAAVKARMPNTFFLIPGYGAQGGTGKDLSLIFKDGLCGVVNSSRGILCAHKNKSDGEDFAIHAADAARAMKEDILQWL